MKCAHSWHVPALFLVAAVALFGCGNAKNSAGGESSATDVATTDDATLDAAAGTDVSAADSPPEEADARADAEADADAQTDAVADEEAFADAADAQTDAAAEVDSADAADAEVAGNDVEIADAGGTDAAPGTDAETVDVDAGSDAEIADVAAGTDAEFGTDVEIADVAVGTDAEIADVAAGTDAEIADDSAGTDASSGTDALAGTDAESGTDAASGTDAVAGTDAAEDADDAADDAGADLDAPPACKPGDCDDGQPCTTDGCGADGKCAHGANSLDCSDGNACTGEDKCADGLCSGTLISCDDGNVCTLDSCAKDTGCKHDGVPGACDDGNVCTPKDSCALGICQGGTPTSCDDGNSCTSDSCDPISGCKHANLSGPCSDSSACTAGDSCKNGACSSGDVLPCADENTCTVDSCSAEFGCTHTHDTATCGTAFLGNIVSLDYDGIEDNAGDKYVVDVATYTQHMKYLHDHGYTVMTFRKFLEYVNAPDFEQKGLPNKPVVLFSDVNSQTFVTNAKPILDGYGFHATLAIQISQLGQSWSMTTATLKDLEEDGYEVASHSWTHEDMTLSLPGTWDKEIGQARKYLMDLGFKAENYAYPYGSWNDDIIAQVKAAGFTAARGTGSEDIRGGGYATFDPARRFHVGCALPKVNTTMAEFLSFADNPHLELEDLYTVVQDAGTLDAIGRGDFEHDHLGSIYLADKGDRVKVKLLIYQAGTYEFSLRVKTGGPGAQQSSDAGYAYRLNGKLVSFTSSGPFVDEPPSITWGYHHLPQVQLNPGFVELDIEVLQDWAALVDWLDIVKVP